jgi:hypothetical protein
LAYQLGIPRDPRDRTILQEKRFREIWKELPEEMSRRVIPTFEEILTDAIHENDISTKDEGTSRVRTVFRYTLNNIVPVISITTHSRLLKELHRRSLNPNTPSSDGSVIDDFVKFESGEIRLVVIKVTDRLPLIRSDTGRERWIMPFVELKSQLYERWGREDADLATGPTTASTSED